MLSRRLNGCVFVDSNGRDFSTTKLQLKKSQNPRVVLFFGTEEYPLESQFTTNNKYIDINCRLQRPSKECKIANSILLEGLMSLFLK